MNVPARPANQPRPLLRAVFLLALVVACAGFIALGTWQLHRMTWKHALIERVEARIHAEPGHLPERERWSEVTAASDEYRRVRTRGRFLDMDPARVQAVTERGPGWWVLAPFETDDGALLLINRGYVASGNEIAASPEGPQVITGLLRLSEPDGAFLRTNVPDEDRWYSRDVIAISTSRALPVDQVAPFFIDADNATSPGASAGEPLGGLTIIRFRDPHLTYALTWFAMAGLSLLGIWLLLSGERSLRQHGVSRSNARTAHDGSTTPDT